MWLVLILLILFELGLWNLKISVEHKVLLSIIEFRHLGLSLFLRFFTDHFFCGALLFYDFWASQIRPVDPGWRTLKHFNFLFKPLGLNISLSFDPRLNETVLYPLARGHAAIGASLSWRGTPLEVSIFNLFGLLAKLFLFDYYPRQVINNRLLKLIYLVSEVLCGKLRLMVVVIATHLHQTVLYSFDSMFWTMSPVLLKDYLVF